MVEPNEGTGKVCPHCGAEYDASARFCPLDGFTLRSRSADSVVGQVLADRYHILRRIGEGGMGRVYLAEHIKMRRQCAVKVMSPSLLSDGESVARFGREASNAARIIHPNVATVFDYGESDGLVYIVMEYVDGEPLSRVLSREAPLPLDRAIELVRQIADGLGAAHELGIVHRDLKPDNILIAQTLGGRVVVKIVDFGIAKVLEDDAGAGLTRTGHVVGTPEFMSPEQLLGDKVDARSDLYALGCIFHLMLTAAPPLSASTREQMVKRRLSEDPAPVSALNPTVPDSVSRIVTRLLARTPAERYGSAADVHHAVSGTHLPLAPPTRLANRYTPRSAPTVAFLQATSASSDVTAVARPSQRRSRALLWGAALVAVAGAALWLRPIAPAAAPAAASVPAASPVPAVVTRTADSTPTPVVDSAALNARRAEQHVRDSAARVVAASTAAMRAPIVRYAHAIEAATTAALRAAYPTISAEQQQSWERNVFSRAEHIATSVQFGDVHTTRDSGEVSFSLLLRYVDKGTKESMNTTLRQHAMLVRRGGAWEIVGLR